MPESLQSQQEKRELQKKAFVWLTLIKSQNTLLYISRKLVSNDRKGCVSVSVHSLSTTTTDFLCRYNHEVQLPSRSAVNITAHKHPTVGTPEP